MHKKFIYRVFSLTMACLLFTSSMGISMDMHYCQGALKSIKLFGEAKNCHEKAKSSHCAKMKSSCKHEGKALTAEEEKDCCNNESLTVEPLDTKCTTVSSVDLTALQIPFVIAFVQCFLVVQSFEKESVEHLIFKPPLPKRDLFILFESFLI